MTKRRVIVFSPILLKSVSRDELERQARELYPDPIFADSLHKAVELLKQGETELELVYKGEQLNG